jgi:hypothetical protein
MVDLNQYRVVWTGALGMPGVSTFYSEGSAAPLLAKLKTLFEALKTSIPNIVTITYPGGGNVIDSVTGQAKATWTATAPAPTVCTASGTYQGPTGAVINWNTGVFTNGRRLRGRTFVVPLANGAYGADGRLTPSNVTSFTAAANAAVGGTDGMVVYSSAHRLDGVVTSATVPSISAVLRSRRD